MTREERIERVLLGDCPDCGTPLERVRKRRGSGHYMWCWKCVRALRRGEAAAAKRKAYEEAARDWAGDPQDVSAVNEERTV